MPIRAASRAAAVRDETPILDSTAETWWASSAQCTSSITATVNPAGGHRPRA